MLFQLPLLLILATCAVARSTPRMSHDLFTRSRGTIPEALLGSTPSSCRNETVIQEEILESGIKVTQIACNNPQSSGGLEERGQNVYYPCVDTGMRDRSGIHRDTGLIYPPI